MMPHRDLLARARVLTAAGISAALVGTVATAGTALAAAPGSLNSGFGSSGSVTGAANTRLFASAVQSNGDVVAVGENNSASGSNPSLIVERFTPSGAPDTSFGSDGIATGPSVSGTAGSIGRAIAIQPDGKIVVVGDGEGQGGSGASGLLVERFNSNGSLDGSFGSGGVQNLLAGNFGAGNAVAIQSNGDIVVGGTEDLTAVPYAVVVRLTSSGSPDSSFGTSGVDVPQVGSYATIQSLAIQSNGDIVFAGSSSPGLQATLGLVGRLQPNGALDTSFAGTGATAKQYATGSGAYSSLNGVAVASNGTIYAAGAVTGSSETADTVVASFTSSGSPNGSFGSSGVAYTQSAQQWLEVNNEVPGGAGIVIAPNNDLIVPGEYDNTTSLTYGVAWAFAPNGSLDTAFGNHGIAVTALSSGNNGEFGGIAISPTTGNLFAAGDEQQLASGYNGIVSSFTGLGIPKTTTTIPSLTFTIKGVASRYSARGVARSGIKLSAGCNQACSLVASVSTSGGTARHLGIKSRVRSCRKVHGRERCTYSEQYAPLTVRVTAKLTKTGVHVFVLRFNHAIAQALEKHTGTRWTVLVASQATTGTHARKSYRKTVQFTR